MPDVFDVPAVKLQKPAKLYKSTLSRKMLGLKQPDEDIAIPRLAHVRRTGRFRTEPVPKRSPSETFEYLLDECIAWLVVFLLAGFVAHQAVKEFRDRQSWSPNPARQGPFRTALPSGVDLGHIHGCCMVTLETSKKGVEPSNPSSRQGGMRLRSNGRKVRA
ncbi:hypothetical protein BSKO_08342 [Bryopsis sp. KO-2023]|nr:hypothetical protein BSKO_08342 [Bryopsis sp. KO-2023]